MKMSKGKIAVLGLLAAAVLPLTYVVYDQFYFKPWYESLSPIHKVYAHQTPFFSTWYGFGTIAVRACLSFIWLSYAMKISKRAH